MIVTVVKRAVIVFSLIVLGYLIVTEQLRKRPESVEITRSGSVDMCLSCHHKEKLDPAHDARVIGCAVCHLGDPLAIEKEPAHKGIVRNPADLRHVAQTCGVSSCHPGDVHKVKNSLMATNRGILGTLLYYWGESDSQDTELTVEELLRTGETSFALDYFRKLCATCHLWKQKNDLPNAPQFFNEKGGGCSACHSQMPTAGDEGGVLVGDSFELVDKEKGKEKPHPLIIRRVSGDHCIRCHNRSGRIGISYRGIFESEGYGTPFQDGKFNSRQLPGGRFYLEVADDIHHARGMECIDCHTREEVMGDGTSYAHYEDQLEISCITCHQSDPGVTRKDRTLINVEKSDQGAVLIGKIDDKSRPLKPARQGVCDFAAHKRVSCEACHSTWVAQCYGCHVRRDEAKTHLDKLELEMTKGRWEEGRSYIRYEQPMLGIWDDEVVVVTPGCQDLVTAVDDKGQLEKSFHRFTMAAINPHTTQARGRNCVDCHASTKTVGLGEGRVRLENGRLQFAPTGKGLVVESGETVPLDGYVTIDGEPLQHSSRPGLRPFNGEELQKILRVGLCVRCHDSYQDPIWAKYSSATACPREAVPGDGGGYTKESDYH